MTSDDFLSLIQSAEKSAHDLLIETQIQCKIALEQYRAEQEKYLSDALEDARKDTKQKLADKQKEMKKVFQDIVTAEGKKLKKLETTVEQKKSALLSAASQYFIKDLLS